MNKETRIKIQDCLKYLEEKYEIENRMDYISEDDMPDMIEDEEVEIDFPDDFDVAAYNYESFLDYMSDIETLQEVDKTTVRTSHIRQTVIDSKYNGWSQFDEKITSYQFDGNFFTVSVVKNPFLIGVMNVKNGNYDDNYGIGPCSFYLALELKYLTEQRLEEIEEKILFEQITFYLTKEFGVAINIVEVQDVDSIVEDDFYDEDDTDSIKRVKVSDLMVFNPMMNLYRQALATENYEIKFLQYYKIIEYISPVVAKLTAYDKLNMRLDLMATTTRDYKYLDSLFSIARKYDTDIKDDYLCISVIQNCVDVIPLWKYIPERLKKQMKKTLEIKSKEIDDNLNDEQLSGLQKQIAKMLYATRNSIVHAKSNYESNGYELTVNELKDCNKMMDIISMSVIQWNERQSDNYKIVCE